MPNKTPWPSCVASAMRWTSVREMDPPRWTAGDGPQISPNVERGTWDAGRRRVANVSQVYLALCSDSPTLSAVPWLKDQPTAWQCLGQSTRPAD